MWRVGLLALIMVAWAATLPWPLTSPNSSALTTAASGTAENANYPLRFMLPEPIPVLSGEFAAMVDRDERLAKMEASQRQADGSQMSRSISSNFASAFSSFFDASSPRASSNEGAKASVPELKPGQMLAVDYDLARLTPKMAPTNSSAGRKPQFNAQDGSLTVSKPLLVDGQSRGSATIRIEEGAQIFIATSSVADALGSRVETLPTRISSALATRSGFIPFNELRGAGIAVEYDPVTDRVSLSTKS